MKLRYKLLSACMLLFVTHATAQQLNFSYDQAGNQTTRQWVCVNCRPNGTAATAETKPLELNVKLIDSVKQQIIKRTITASPNPFLENLNLNWQLEEGVSVKNVAVFSVSGVKMHEANPSPQQNNVVFPFQNLASGMYILYITFSDNRRESIKVIKK